VRDTPPGLFSNNIPEEGMIVNHEYLEVIIRNETPGEIDETATVFGRHSYTFGVVGVGVSAANLGCTYPIGRSVVVRWRDAAGVKRECAVDISKTYKPEAPGRLTFTVSGTNVTASFEKIRRE
jgi:hypothetical protein